MLQLRGPHSSFRSSHVQMGLNLQVNSDPLGCPAFSSEVDGYFIHSDEPPGPISQPTRLALPSTPEPLRQIRLRTACASAASAPISSSTASSVSDCATRRKAVWTCFFLTCFKFRTYKRTRPGWSIIVALF